MKRILTAIIAIPILLFTVWSRVPYFFVAVVVLAVALALNELYGLAVRVGCKPLVAIGHLASQLVIACFVLQRLDWVIAVLSATAIALLLSELSRC